jgi:outer membrane lipoprotein-sorting protein
MLAPFVVGGGLVLAAWVPTVTAGASTPKLPPLTAQQLIAKAVQARVAGLAATVRWTADLGIPDLTGLVGGGGSYHDNSFSWSALLSGSHSIKVWDAGADRQRLALPGTLSETDFVRNGNQAWTYESSTNQVTHYLLPRPAAGEKLAATDVAASEGPALTPDELAQRLLAHLTPSTSVSVASPIYVAGRPAYELVLAPAKGTAGAIASTIREIAVAVDSGTGLPLRLSVSARGQSSPALQIGFSSVSFSVPSASEFRAPVGGTVVTRHLKSPHRSLHRAAARPAADQPGADQPVVAGPAWAQIITIHPGAGRSASRVDRRLVDATAVVTGRFGTARLLQTNLINALFLPDGSVIAGFVTPAALEAAAPASSS